MFEHRKQPLLPRVAFLARMTRSAGIACGIVLMAWALGTVGYHELEGLSWIDALLNAAMILSGMGPVAELHTTAGKLFASFYAILSGFLFITVAGVLFAPLFHRMIHRFHLEAD
jgi:hypothetical protein